MAWSGKLVGGLIGGMLGGPLGAGLGATMGHVLGDGQRALDLQRLDWQQHAFGEAGPGMVVVPVFIARGLAGADVRVTVRCADFSSRATVTPDADPETVTLPRVFIPYAELPERSVVTVSVRLRAAGREDQAEFRVRTPNAVRRLGGSGPARAVMALVAAARAAGDLSPAAERFIRDPFAEGVTLDDDGRAWLTDWLAELRAAAVGRLAPDRVAPRLAPHLDDDGRARLLEWLWRGTAAAWPAPASAAWIEALAEQLGATRPPSAEPSEDDDREALATLGLPATADDDAVRAAWHKLVQRWHPDHARTPEEAAVRNRRLAEVNAAYRRLRGR
jgi:hypothetical protein